MNQSRLTEFGFPKQESRVRRNTHPVKSICVSCGEEKWLNWISAKEYLCDDCIKDAKSRRMK